MLKSEQQITDTDARQGSRKKMNLRVLIGSLTLCLLAGVALYFAYMQGPRLEQQPQQPATERPR